MGFNETANERNPILKSVNQALSPVRIIVEEGHATVRAHGAPSSTKSALTEIINAMKAGELSVSPGVYRIEVTRDRLFRYEYNLRPV